MVASEVTGVETTSCAVRIVDGPATAALREDLVGVMEKPVTAEVTEPPLAPVLEVAAIHALHRYEPLL